ncbi:MAG: ribosome silencing factor [Nitrospiraceae bacterium]|nr:ribosome silencing factor [Nitrospiraceae bacterium]
MKSDIPSGTPTTEALVRAAADAILDKKGEDLVVLDLTEVTPLTDYFIICAGNNSRQIRAITEEVETKVKEAFAVSPRSIEGLGDMSWVLIDYVDFVVHIFLPETRDYYSLERLWGDAARLEIPVRV